MVKIIDGNYKKDGLRVYEDTCPTLSARDYKEPKMVFDDKIHNTIRSGHTTNNQGGVEIQ